jgi:hypothetical protein
MFEIVAIVGDAGPFEKDVALAAAELAEEVAPC